jgi:hypothetical protein
MAINRGLRVECFLKPRENELHFERRMNMSADIDVDVIPFNEHLWDISLDEIHLCYLAQLELPAGIRLVDPRVEL